MKILRYKKTVEMFRQNYLVNTRHSIQNEATIFQVDKKAVTTIKKLAVFRHDKALWSHICMYIF